VLGVASRGGSGNEPKTALPHSREPLRRARRSCGDRAEKSGQRSESGRGKEDWRRRGGGRRVGRLLPVSNQQWPVGSSGYWVVYATVKVVLVSAWVLSKK
jgi:hypothetical protein